MNGGFGLSTRGERHLGGPVLQDKEGEDSWTGLAVASRFALMSLLVRAGWYRHILLQREIQQGLAWHLYLVTPHDDLRAGSGTCTNASADRCSDQRQSNFPIGTLA